MAKITTTSPLAPSSFPKLPEVAGFRFATLAAGIRYQGRTDLTMIEAVPGTSVAAVFTKSTTAGHPVLWGRRILPRGTARAVIINAGNANVFRGAEGDAAVEAEAEAVAKALACDPKDVFVASTGVIGERLPVEKITAAVPALVERLAAGSIAAAAAAIMTTDTFAKGSLATAEIGGRTVTIAGIAKGSGMIAPDMATMLCFVVTDAKLPSSVLQPLLADGADKSFNATTVDGDTSTSDTLLLMASGEAGNASIEHPDDPALAAFKAALDKVLLDLALQVVRDGEGAQKLIEISIKGALDDKAARRLGLVVANSPLVKTAIAGGDANWGRIVMAVGRSGETIELDRLGVAFGGVPVARAGGAVPDLDEAPVAAHLAGHAIKIDIEVGSGPGQATVWTCDLTHGYIDINADYRS